MSLNRQIWLPSSYAFYFVTLLAESVAVAFTASMAGILIFAGGLRALQYSSGSSTEVGLASLALVAVMFVTLTLVSLIAWRLVRARPLFFLTWACRLLGPREKIDDTPIPAILQRLNATASARRDWVHFSAAALWPGRLDLPWPRILVVLSAVSAVQLALVSIAIYTLKQNHGSATLSQFVESYPIEPVAWMIAIMAALLLSGLLTSAYIKAVRINLQASATAVLAHDGRAPVLLLRPFSKDGWQGMTGGSSMISGQFAEFEDQIASLMTAVGPFIAIGDPRDTYARLGAARQFASDNEWRTLVSNHITAAGLIVVLLGDSSWLDWEIEQIAQQRQLDRTIFINLPNRKRGESYRTQPLPDVLRQIVPIEGGLPQELAGATDVLAFAVPPAAPTLTIRHSRGPLLHAEYLIATALLHHHLERFRDRAGPAVAAQRSAPATPPS